MQPAYGLARGARFGIRDAAARVPWIEAMSTKTVALFGLGALGAPCALELAKAGLGRLRMLDGDYVDPGTASRWPLGAGWAGASKALAVAHTISSNWPWTEVVPFARHLGRVRQKDDPDPRPDERVMADMLDGASLVLDATAEFGVNYLLSDLAWDQGLPYVSVMAEHGAWGGSVYAVEPGGGPCWACIQESLKNRTLPRPPSDPKGAVQPAGCAAPTFTGSSFELLPLVAEAIRTAVSILTSKEVGGYPPMSRTVAIGSWRDSDGRLTVPTWREYRLPTVPGCVRPDHHTRQIASQMRAEPSASHLEVDALT